MKKISLAIISTGTLAGALFFAQEPKPETITLTWENRNDRPVISKVWTIDLDTGLLNLVTNVGTNLSVVLPKEKYQNRFYKVSFEWP
jgi:hypothetical protein